MSAGAGLSREQVIDQVGSAKFKNVLPAVAVDLSLPSFAAWPEVLQNSAGTFSLVFASNVTHITPLACTEGLMIPPRG